MRVIKTYKVSWLGNKGRANNEKTMFADGWKVIQEEDIMLRSWPTTCLMAIIFFPLAFLPLKYKTRKVTYEKD